MVLFLHILTTHIVIISRVLTQISTGSFCKICSKEEVLGKVTYGFKIPRNKLPYQWLDYGLPFSIAMLVFYSTNFLFWVFGS